MIKKIEYRRKVNNCIVEFGSKVESYQISEQAVIICLFLEKGFQRFNVYNGKDEKLRESVNLIIFGFESLYCNQSQQSRSIM